MEKYKVSYSKNGVATYFKKGNTMIVRTNFPTFRDVYVSKNFKSINKTHKFFPKSFKGFQQQNKYVKKLLNEYKFV